MRTPFFTLPVTDRPPTIGHRGLTRLLWLATPLAAISTTMLGAAFMATSEGAEFGEDAAFWTRPATRLAAPLLDFASPDRVYATWLVPVSLLLLLIPVAVLRCDRHPVSNEPLRRWPRRIALAGASATAAGALVIAVLLRVMPPDHSIVNALYLTVLLPGQLVSWLASTAVGISAWRQSRPVGAGMLMLAGTVLVATVTMIVGHNSMVLTWQLLGWALVSSRGVDRFR